MNIQDEFRSWSLALLKDPLFLQITPLAIFVLFPLIVLLSVQAVLSSLGPSSATRQLAMVFESFSFNFPWNWSSSSGTQQETKKLKKKARTHSEQIELNGHARPQHKNDVHDGYYPGLVNISGTYCFMNSTMQAMASLSYLLPYLSYTQAKAIQLDVASPVVDALLALLQDLNTPRTAYHSIRPLEMITTLVNHSRSRHNSLFSSREHQDAQELFQLVSECIKKEVVAVDNEGQRDRGLGGLSQVRNDANKEIGKSVFDGLTANRRSCVECGYTEAVMHFAFDSWQLAVPRYAASCHLEDCLAEYTKLEMLNDCICRKCSMKATHQKLRQEADRLAAAANADPAASISKKKRVKEARKLELRVQSALDHGRLEEDIKGVKLEKVFSRASTKQAMIARPPQVLALHLNRSLSYGHYAAKNTVRILFPEFLDLTPFTTSGNLSTKPSVPISSQPPQLPRSTTPTPATYAVQRIIYRLSAVVCHYGQHSFGHYVCYRRKPRPISYGSRRFAPPRFADPLGCDCEKCQRYGPVRDDDEIVDSMYRPGRGWLRISDDSVKECGIETVVQEGSGAFMLYYERVVQSRPGIYPHHNSPRSSEETLKPRVNGSTTSVASLDGDVVVESRGRGVMGPRVVRSVVAGRRSVSAARQDRDPLSASTPSLINGSAVPLKANMSQASLSSASTNSSSSLWASAPDIMHQRTSSSSSSLTARPSGSRHPKSSQLTPVVDQKA
ncbi:cysteine proteinase [Suillus decipiens]|nr:cysteine proteinase [Suillus decipiens]